MLRLRFAFAPILAVGLLTVGRLGYAQAPSTSGETSPPPAVRPQWLTERELQRIERDPDAFKSLDAFVGFAGAGTPADRTRRVTAGVLTAKVMLHDLYYQVDLSVTGHPADDPAFHRALSEFERRAGLKVDGIFTGAEFDKLQYYSTLAHYLRTHTSPLKFKQVSHQPGYIHAEGSWVIQGDESAYPMNVTDIDCWKEFRNCIIADAHVTTPRDGDSGSSYVSVDTSYWEITSWSETRVVAEQSGLCRRNVLTVDEQAKQVFQVQTDLNAADCKDLIGPMSKPRMTTLEDGVKVGLAHYNAVREAVKRVSNFPFDSLAAAYADGQSAK